MAKAKTVFMFSGQGSQYFDMGRSLFDHEPVFRKQMLILDGIAHELCGRSVIDAIYSSGHSRADAFALTALTYPAIFMVEYSLAELLMQASILPDFTFGSSMGSFAAAAVAQFIDIEDALTAVIRQASALEAFCEPGGMIVVLGNPAIYSEDFLSKRSDLAGVNYSSHFVVSSIHRELGEIEAQLKARNLAYQRLPVSFAFHSRWIDPAKAPFESFMKSVRCKSGQLPMMCCDHAEILGDLPDNYFWDIVRNPIRFRDAVAKLEEQGPHRYIDVGPSGTLATFLKYGLRRTSKSTIHSVITPYGDDRRNLAVLFGLR